MNGLLVIVRKRERLSFLASLFRLIDALLGYWYCALALRFESSDGVFRNIKRIGSSPFLVFHPWLICYVTHLCLIDHFVRTGKLFFMLMLVRPIQ